MQGFDGEMISYSKFGFNHQAINTSNGAYPTESFSVLYSSLGYKKLFLEHLSFGASFAFGGIVFDSTKSQTKGGLAYKYFGYYSGSFGNKKATPYNTQNYFIKDLYLDYKNSFFQLIIGRFLFTHTDWLTGRNEGMELHFFTQISDSYFAISERRSSYGGKWFKTYKILNSSKIPTLAMGTCFKIDSSSLLNLYFQAQPKLYYASGIRVTYEKDFNLKHLNLTSKTDIIGLYVYHTSQARQKYSSYDVGEDAIFALIDEKNPDLQGYIGRKVGKGGFSLGIKQTFKIKDYDLGIQFYGNIGNPNEFIGHSGNPIGIDLNDNSIYDRGTAGNAIFDSNSLNSILSLKKSFNACTIRLIERFTVSDRSEEENFSINASYKIRKNTSIGINLSAYFIKTKVGHKIYQSYLSKSRWDDRSFASTYIIYKF
ncbi:MULTISPECIES: outer membrane family protein [unclassified Helicobacter]|uniref:outer membrane family protein n=1 Tax=unclassified Helicobacter TaxID=2593540 RepID=UPI002279170A|nr:MULTISPECIES: outer membrane family protein [unclassified Helicobacter]